MKKFTFTAAAMLLACGTAFAQFSNTSGGGSAAIKRTGTGIGTDGYSAFYFQWNPSKMKIDQKDADDQGFTALTLGWNKAIGIMPTQPLFLEVGGALQFSFYSEEWDEDMAEDVLYRFDSEEYDLPKNKWNMFSVKIPVSLTYDWAVSDKLTIAPYAGLTLRFNLAGRTKSSLDNDYLDDLEDYDRGAREEYEEMYTDGKNIFDKEDMGGKNSTANRFQIGWQIGVNFKVNSKWYLGAAYGADFMEYSKKTKISQPSLTAGILF